MIALGWAQGLKDVPDGCHLVPVGGLALVAVDDGGDRSPRSVLGKLVACAAACPAFLPYPPPWRLHVAAALADADPYEVSRRVAATAGRAQITVGLAMRCALTSVGPRGVSGRDWLSARGAAERRRHDAVALARDRLRAILAASGVETCSERSGRGRLAYDCTDRREAVPETMARLADRVASSAALRGHDVRITGPWPLLALARAGPT